MVELIIKHWKTKTAKDAFALYVGRGINLLLGIVSTLIYGVVFLNTQIAVISLFEMVVNLFVAFGFNWSAVGVVRFGKEEYIKNQSMNYTSSIRSGLILPLLALSILLLVTYRNSFIGYIGTDDIFMIIYLILNILLLVLHGHITSIFSTAEKHVHNALFFLAEGIGKCGILALFYLGVVDVTPEFYLKINVFLAFTLIILRVPFLDKAFLFPITRVKKNDYLRFLKFVIPQIYGFAGLYVINWMDLYFIRKYCNMDDLGAYQFLYSIFLKVCSFALLLNTLFFPKILAWKQSNAEKVRRYLRTLPHAVMVVAAVSAALSIFTYKPVFELVFNQKYMVAYSSFNILLCSVAFYFITHLFIPVLNSYDRVGYIQMVNIISALSNLSLDYILIKRFGIIAAALGTFVAYFLKFSLLTAAVGKMFNMKYKALGIVSAIILVAVLAYFTQRVGG
jgi:O-antigen/teichoic acid export membrane protein